MVCGLLAEGEPVEASYAYACDKQPVLRQFLRLPAGLPAHDTLTRVVRPLDPAQLEACRTRRGSARVAPWRVRQLSVDGKPACSWCLAQVPRAEQRREALARPQVWELVDVAGSVVSLDALGSQPARVARLRERAAAYGLALSQRELFAQVQARLAPWRAQAPAPEQRQQGHGRGEHRRLGLSRACPLVDAAAPWVGLLTARPRADYALAARARHPGHVLPSLVAAPRLGAGTGGLRARALGP